MNPSPDTDHGDTGDASGSDERLLRRATQAEAARVSAEPDWDDVLGRAARGTRSGSTLVRRLPVVAAAAAIIVVAAVALLIRSDGDDATDLTTDPSPAPTAVTTVPPTTVPPTTGAPTTARADGSDSTVPHELEPNGRDIDPIDLPAGAPLADGELVALVATEVSGDGFTLYDLVVLDGRDGATVRTLSGGHDSVEGGVFAVSVSADRRTVLFSVATSACGTDIHAVAADGSSPDVVLFEGNAAVLSPDRRYLALDPRVGCTPEQQIELLPVEGGRTILYGHGGNPLAGLDDIDPLHGGLGGLAFEDEDSLVYEVSDGSASTLYAFDLSTGENPVVSSGAEDGTVFSGLHTRRDGTVGVVAACCDDGADFQPDTGGLAAVRLSILDEGTLVDERSIDAQRVTSALLDPVLGSVVVTAADDVFDNVLLVEGATVRTGVVVVAG